MTEETKKYIKLVKKTRWKYDVFGYKKAFLGGVGRDKKGKFRFYPDKMCFDNEIWFYEDCLRQLADELKQLNSSNGEEVGYGYDEARAVDYNLYSVNPVTSTDTY